MRKLFIIICALLLLSGCGAKEAPAETPFPSDTAESFIFNAGGTEIEINAEGDPIIEALGEPLGYFETESCAFEGIDKTYTYSGFELTLYPDEDGAYRVWSVFFTDDTVETPEGIGLGSSLDEVLSAYGNDYTEASGQYVYLKGETRLIFIVADGKVTSIEYSLNY